ncbi:MAG: oleate hydratase [Propionibacteriaceae bacterium]|jgi:oleate hydratase|nr:oleate hydratase [Propionibacteriaceae bacterium]
MAEEKKQHAYMIGAGVGCLAAAVYLIRDGHWDGSQITIMGLDTHGANDGAVTSAYEGEYGNQRLADDAGYLARGGRMLNEETYENLWDLLDSIGSLTSPGKSVTREILDFDHAHPTHDVGRLLDSHGPRTRGDADDWRHMQFTMADRVALTRLMTLPASRESELNDVTIEQWFASSPHIFETNFWLMWETTFAFLKNNSAMELRRYMNRMILEFSRINTLAGVTRTPYNQYESIILPMRAWLTDHGVTLITNRKVTGFVFADDDPLRDEIRVTGLRYEDVNPDNANSQADGGAWPEAETHEIAVGEDDFVFCSNGSITDSASLGDLDHPAIENMEYAPSAALWKQATGQFFGLGHPDKFFGDRSQSEWTSFTVTTSDHVLLNEIAAITRQQPGNALNTFVESTPLISLVVHHQPHFAAQKPNETVFWGYSLYPRRLGDFVKKPFIEMTGREMLEETLGQLARVDTRPLKIDSKSEEIWASIVNVVPAHMPYASALFARRALGDRPDVVPAHSKNLAFISQFVEMDFDMVFTEQYSIRAAQMAVYHFLDLPSSALTKLHHYERDPRILARAAVTMLR